MSWQLQSTTETAGAGTSKLTEEEIDMVSGGFLKTVSHVTSKAAQQQAFLRAKSR